MNTEEFLKRITNYIKTDTGSSAQEASKRVIITMVFIELTRDFFFWVVEKHREIVDEFLKEKYKDAKVR